MRSTVHALVAHQASLQPDAIYAVDCDGGPSLNYGTLAQRCRQVAALLLAQGSVPGDTVSLVMPNGLATLQWLLGAMQGGWCVNPVNLLSQPDQMRYVLAHSDCRLVIVSPDWEAQVRALLQDIPRNIGVLVSTPDHHGWPEAEADLPAPLPEAMALLMYTSGTTGQPKGDADSGQPGSQRSGHQRRACAAGP